MTELTLPQGITWGCTVIETYERMEPGAPRGVTRHIITAHFLVEPGTLADLPASHDPSIKLVPKWLQVSWYDLALQRIAATGSRRLKSSVVSDRSGSKHEWWRTSIEKSRSLHLGLTSVRAAGITGVADGEAFIPVPQIVFTAIDAYLDVHPLPPELTFWQPGGKEVRA